MAMRDDASSPVNARQVQMDNHSSTPLVEVSQVIQKRRRRKRASTSELWQHFHEPAKEPNVACIATCKYCGKEYMWVPENGTGTLWQHLKHRCPEAPLKDVEEPRREHGTPKNSFNYDDCRRELVEMIITDEMPFTIVEKKRVSSNIQEDWNQDFICPQGLQWQGMQWRYSTMKMPS